MNIKENLAIKLYNYNPFVLSITTNIRTYQLEPCYDMEIPTFATVTYAELDYFNSVSSALRNGMIVIDESVRGEVYEALHIIDTDKILFNQDIEDILINPTREGLDRIISSTDESVFNRVNGIYVGLVNSGEYDISNRVTNIIQMRRDEIRRGILKTQIQLVAKDDNIQPANEDIEKVKEQNANLQNQLNQMQKMMEQLLSAKAEEKVSPTSTTPKKAGRPKKTTE